MDIDRFLPFEEIYAYVDQFVATHGAIAHSEVLGLSEEGREIRAVFVTDPEVDSADKEVALVICGRHGQEIGTRVVGPAMLDWLASEAAAETRRRQIVVVVPVANPDGCVRGEFWAPNDGLSDTEQRTIGQLAMRCRPDAVIDIHSWGDTLDAEALVRGNTYNIGEDIFTHESVVQKMAAHAAANGYPYLIHRSDLVDAYNNFYCGLCYENFHSLIFGMEVNHVFLQPDECAQSGVVAIEALLAEGNRRSPWEVRAGYPTRILLGDVFTSLRATGRTCSELRDSRIEIWQNRKSFTGPRRIFEAPNVFRVSAEYAGPSRSYPFALVCRIRGFPEIRSVRVNGKDVEPTLFRDNCSTYVSGDIQPGGDGSYEMVVRT